MYVTIYTYTYYTEDVCIINLVRDALEGNIIRVRINPLAPQADAQVELATYTHNTHTHTHTHTHRERERERERETVILR